MADEMLYPPAMNSKAPPLRTTAGENRESLETRLRQALTDSENAVALKKLCEEVQLNATLSMNMRSYALRSFLENGRYLNAEEFAQQLATALDVDKDGVIEGILKNFAKARREFEACTGFSNSTKYAALNIGGLGLSKYGEFCVIAKIEYVKNAAESVYLSGDSLSAFMKDAGEIDYNAIHCSSVLEDGKHLLVGLKHSSDGNLSDKSLWPGMVCSSNCYVEAIFEKEFVIDDVEEIRVDKSIEKNLVEMALSAFMGRADEATKAYAMDIISVKNIVKNRPLNWKLV